MTRGTRSTPLESERDRERALLADLEAIYRDVEASYREHRCPASTDCCRFGVTGREPYVTSIELAAVRRALAARGGRLSERRRALPLYPGDVRDERICPLLDRDGRCSIYAARPLGCRTFWCERSETTGEPVGRDAVAAFVRRIQALAARHEHDGDRGRPLTRALSE